MAHPNPLLSPTCSLGSSGCSAREEGQQVCPGTRAGRQAPLTQAETPAQTSGPRLPPQAGVETHIGIRVANDRDNLHNKNSSSCCPESPGTHSALPAVTGPQTAWGTCCCDPWGRQKEGLERLQPGLVGSVAREPLPPPTADCSSEVPHVERAALGPGVELMGKRTHRCSLFISASVNSGCWVSSWFSNFCGYWYHKN